MQQPDPRNVPGYSHIVKVFQTPHFTEHPENAGSAWCPSEGAVAVTGADEAVLVPAGSPGL